MKQKKAMRLAAAGLLALGAGAAMASLPTNNVSGGIGVDTTWTSNVVWRLMDPVFVTNGATLTIQPGTVIVGKNLSNGSLIISRGSKINAVGTKERPIVFTVEGDNHFVGPNPQPGTGVWAQKNNGVGKKWGGVILLGRTYITSATNSPNANISRPIEGIADVGAIGRYGGGDDNDDSGVMKYVSIRYGGYILGAANEINGLTMGGVGRQTQISHIEVYQNADDDYEFFGGTVNTKYLVAWNSTDDQFDYDEGYRGKGQFMLSVHGVLINPDFAERSDKGTEYDGALPQDELQPSSIGTMFNWTMIGLGRDSGQKRNSCINLRDGAGGRWYNCLWMDFGGAPALFEGGSSGPNHPGSTGEKFLQDYIAGGLFGPPNPDGTPSSGNGYDHEQVDPSGRQTKKAELMYNVWWKCGTNVAFSCPPNTNNLGAIWGADGNDGNKAFYDPGLFVAANGLNNYYLDEAGGFPSSIPGGPFASPCAVLTRESVGKSIGDGFTYYQVDKLDPRPRAAYADAMMTSGRVPPNDGFFTPVAFIGAFGKNKNWAHGWTLVSRLGLLDTPGVTTAEDYTGIVPSVGTNATHITAGLACDSIYNGIKADWYLYIDAGPYGKYYYDASKTTMPLSTRWVAFTTAEPPPSSGNAALGTVPTSPVLEKSILPNGTYTVTLAVDLKVNVPAAANKIDEMHTFTRSFTFTKP